MLLYIYTYVHDMHNKCPTVILWDHVCIHAGMLLSLHVCTWMHADYMGSCYHVDNVLIIIWGSGMDLRMVLHVHIIWRVKSFEPFTPHSLFTHSQWEHLHPPGSCSGRWYVCWGSSCWGRYGCSQIPQVEGSARCGRLDGHTQSVCPCVCARMHSFSFKVYSK